MSIEMNKAIDTKLEKCLCLFSFDTGAKIVAYVGLLLGYAHFGVCFLVLTGTIDCNQRNYWACSASKEGDGFPVIVIVAGT